MKVLNLLTAGDIGGIEIINYDFGQYSKCEQGYAFLFGLGKTYDRMKESRYKVYDLSMYAHKISKERYRKLKEIASQYDIIVVHHGDPYLKLYYLFIVNVMKIFLEETLHITFFLLDALRKLKDLILFYMLLRR